VGCAELYYRKDDSGKEYIKYGACGAVNYGTVIDVGEQFIYDGDEMKRWQEGVDIMLAKKGLRLVAECVHKDIECDGEPCNNSCCWDDKWRILPEIGQ